MFLSIALACGLFAIAPDFIPLYLGDGFDKCIVVMQALVITAILTSWANVIRTQYLIPFQKDSVYVYSVIAGAITNFGLNLILIKKYGAIGAVIGTVAAEMVVAFIQTWVAKDKLDCKKMIIKSVPYLLFGFVMVLVVRLCSLIHINIFFKLLIEVIVGTVVYVGLSIIYKYKTNKDELLAYTISH